MNSETGNAVTLSFALPSEKLRPYVTTYYLMEVCTSQANPVIEDYLHPEWFNLRFQRDDWGLSAIGDEPLARTPSFSVTGPSTKPIRVRIDCNCGGGASGTWGIGLLPLGWAKLLGANGIDYADRIADGCGDPTFAAFHPLAQRLTQRFYGEPGDFRAEVAAIEEVLGDMLSREVPRADKLVEIHEALIDPDIVTATQLADRVNMTLRSLERLSRRSFGFPPKLLLRRQRFLRSLAKFMIDPSLKWMNAMDCQYHDQAHFVRDFKRFMGMTPSEYAKLPKPILVAAAQARMAAAGAAVQGLHHPNG